ncbi:MAG: cytochrome c3 family protein [Eubacteriales bacterium]
MANDNNNGHKNANRASRRFKKRITAVISVVILAALVLTWFKLNPVSAAVLDSTPPSLLNAEAVSKQIVYLTFDEPIKDPNTNGGTISIAGFTVTSTLMTDARVVKLALAPDLGTGNVYTTPTKYTVNVNVIKDLLGNASGAMSKDFDAFTPHGKYAPYPVTSGNSTRQCAQCHITHSASAGDLLSSVTIKKVCFVCHGYAGTSIYKVENEFYNWSDANVGTSVYSASLHKSLDIDSPGNNVLTCTDCHDPHGTRWGGGSNILPKLLVAKNVYGAVYTSANGNWFCLACHSFGEVTKYGTYWDATGGLHNWGMTVASNVYYGIHFDNRITALQPSSGTNVTCSKCHERHGSTYADLGDHSRANGEEDQCYKCHNTGTNGMTGVNVYNVITTSVSQHKVSSTVYGKIECSSCHGPHTAGKAKYAAGSVYSAISDPNNTKNPFITSSGRISQFCLKCHDSTPPVAVTNSTTVIPYTVSFVDPGFRTNGGKWNKDAPLSFLNSGHYTNAQLQGQTDAYGNSKAECTLCHEWHGTAYNWLVRLDEDKNGTDGICLQCHKSGTGYTAPAGVTSLDVKTQLGLAYNHPTIQAGYSGRHSNREDYNGVAESSTNRHAQCYDCHDPHTVKAGTGQLEEIGNVSGVVFSNTAWASWGTATATEVFLDSATNNRQAYLCYKCHSKYAYGASPPNPTPGSNGYSPGVFAQTDVAKEFNPSNKARHVVEGTSQMPTFTYNSTVYYYGKFVNGWTATSVMKCTDCHMPATGAKGPHGSSIRFILKAAWTPTQTATMTSTDLCFLCHDYAFYYSGGNTGSATLRSQFSSGGGSLGYNGHATQHPSGKQRNCSNCHGGLPHGWNHTDSNAGGQALFGSTDPRPYKDGSYLGDIQTQANRPPQQWTSQHSGTSCGGTGGCT